jgi:hypothetical protein
MVEKTYYSGKLLEKQIFEIEKSMERYSKTEFSSELNHLIMGESGVIIVTTQNIFSLLKI